jgi:hypothetical protein
VPIGQTATVDRYEQQFRVEGGVLHVRLSGVYPNERLAITENLFKPLMDECRRENCREAIVDARELQVEFDTLALFRAGVDAAALNEFGLRVALIARADMLSAFFDDVTHNRAAQVRVFTDLESAQTWVREP